MAGLVIHRRQIVGDVYYEKLYWLNGERIVTPTALWLELQDSEHVKSTLIEQSLVIGENFKR